MPEETIGIAWLADASGNKKYAHSETSAVYDAESEQTLDKVIHPTYSTEEWVPTGEFWIDGKQVYRRVFAGEFSPSSVIAGTENVETIVDYGGNFKEIGSDSELSIPYIYNSSSTVMAYAIYKSDAGGVRIASSRNKQPINTRSNLWIKATLSD